MACRDLFAAKTCRGHLPALPGSADAKNVLSLSQLRTLTRRRIRKRQLRRLRLASPSWPSGSPPERPLVKGVGIVYVDALEAAFVGDIFPVLDVLVN